MRVLLARGLEGARGAAGAVVVIDVLRAFTTAAFALEAGAEALELVGTPAEALARRRADPGLLLVGEVGGRPIDGFDHGNSPEAVESLRLDGRRVVLRSSSGVQGALAVLARTDSVLLGGLTTAAATVRALRGEELVTLVAMGASAADAALDGPEDDACAELLEARLLGREPDAARWLALARSGPAARAALDPTETWITPGDLARALALDRHDFAIRARLEAGRVVARREFQHGRESAEDV